jgi:protein gp37
VFCASLADVFDNEVPEQWRTDLWELIRSTPRLDWLLLTKRIGNVKAMLPPDWDNSVFGYNNVWLGITVVTQEEAERDIPKLLHIPSRVRFLSCEPLMESIDLTAADTFWAGIPLADGSRWVGNSGKIDWVIVGGESGSKPRPMAQEWATELARQCASHRVAFFFKQGSQANWPAYKDFSRFSPELQIRQWPETIFSSAKGSAP